MYGKQFSFLATERDMTAIDQVLRAHPEVLLLDFDKQTAVFTPRLEPSESPYEPWIARAPKPALVSKWRSAEKLVADVDEDRSEVIEYWQSGTHEGRMSRGRLYYRHRNSNGSARDPEFCRWADRVMARVKRTMIHDKALYAYVAPDAREAIDSGRLTVGNL